MNFVRKNREIFMIPEKWKADIIRRSWIEEMCDNM